MNYAKEYYMSHRYSQEYEKLKMTKGYQHEGFPSGPPPQYSLRLKPLNFGVRMGSGVLGLVWPIAIAY